VEQRQILSPHNFLAMKNTLNFNFLYASALVLAQIFSAGYLNGQRVQTFEFTNNLPADRQPAGKEVYDLHIEFDASVSLVNYELDPADKVKKAGPFPNVSPAPPATHKKHDLYGGTVAAGESVKLQFKTDGNKEFKIEQWWWTYRNDDLSHGHKFKDAKGREIVYKVDGKKFRNGDNGLTIISVVPEGGSDNGAWVTITGSGLAPFGKPAVLTTSPALLDELNDVVFADPALFGMIMERLGSEFYIGDPDGATFPGAVMEGENRIIPGLGIGVGFRSGLEIGLRAGLFQTSWTGSFPITVFPFDGSEPTGTQGVLSASASGVLGDAQLRYYLPGRALRPYIGGGVRGQWALRQSSSADIAGIALPFEMKPMPDAVFSAFGDAGLRLNLGRHAFLQAGASYGKIPGGDYGLMGEAALGFHIGR
jgi:hypothetical protein